MLHGHPETYDDSILEAGNRRAKVGKRNLFWGGTNEPGAMFVAKRTKRVKLADGCTELQTVEVPRRAPIGIEAQHVENTYIVQTLAMARGQQERSALQEETKRLKSEAYARQCDDNMEGLEKVEAAVSSA